MRTPALITCGTGALSLAPPVGDSRRPGTCHRCRTRTGWGVHVLAVARIPGRPSGSAPTGRGSSACAAGAERLGAVAPRFDRNFDLLRFRACAGVRSPGADLVWHGRQRVGSLARRRRTWKNWTYDQLGPEWQYVTPDGIATRGDTTVIATADGLQITTDDGATGSPSWMRSGPPARGSGGQCTAAARERVRAAARRPTGRAGSVSTLRGSQRLRRKGAGWSVEPPRATCPCRPAIPSSSVRQPIEAPRAASARRVSGRRASPATRPRRNRRALPLTAWLRRPIARDDNWYIDQTYRYGSTMGGNFQQHQGVEFNNPDGTPVHAIAGGRSRPRRARGAGGADRDASP